MFRPQYCGISLQFANRLRLLTNSFFVDSFRLHRLLQFFSRLAQLLIHPGLFATHLLIHLTQLRPLLIANILL